MGAVSETGTQHQPQTRLSLVSGGRLALRRLKREKVIRPTAAEKLISGGNQEWAMDFVFDTIETGRNIKMLTLVDG